MTVVYVAGLVLVSACGGSAAGMPGASNPPDGSSDAAPGGCATDRTGSLMALMMDVRGHMPGAGTNALTVPSTADRDQFASVVLRVLDGDDAAACALPAPYKLVRLTDPQAGLLRVVVEPSSPSRFYGTYAANPASARPLVVEAPHPIADTDTDLQSTAVFVQDHAKYLLVAGTHRCANLAASPCTGTTTACGASAPYRESDAAHEDTLPFYAVHAMISMHDSSLNFLQLHGNGESSCPDALVSDSSGTWSETGLAGRLAGALSAALPAPPAPGMSVGKCGLGFPTSGCNLCGTDNVEARDSAGAANACTQAGSSYGHFVHVEQHLTLRTAPYTVMVDAVNAAFP